MDRGEVRRVTVAVKDLARARALYSGMLGMREVRAFRLTAEAVAEDAEARRFASSLGLPEPAVIEALDLEQPGTRVGAVRLLRIGEGAAERINEGARAYDHGYV
ncbi:MAG: hypothetical protein ABI565_10330, partial [Vicinamibacteria bacterium]